MLCDLKTDQANLCNAGSIRGLKYPLKILVDNSCFSSSLYIHITAICHINSTNQIHEQSQHTRSLPSACADPPSAIFRMNSGMLLNSRPPRIEKPNPRAPRCSSIVYSRSSAACKQSYSKVINTVLNHRHINFHQLLRNMD